MAKSRVETFKDYRKSILNDDDNYSKLEIDSSLENTAQESKNGVTEAELIYLKKIQTSKFWFNFLFLLPIGLIALAIIIFGLVLFL